MALHHWFVPHKENDHKPHFLHRNVIAGLTIAVVVVQLTYIVSVTKILPSMPFVAAVLPAVLQEETNKERLALGAQPLVHNELLAMAAQEKANDMAARGYFSHVTPDGMLPWTFLDRIGYDYAVAGENLAVNFTDSKKVMNAWMNSPSHRANIVNGQYTEIGMATAEGVYKGRRALFVVQFFGRPSTATGFAIAPSDLGAAAQQANFFERLAVSPNSIVTYLYAGLSLLLVLALLLKIFVKPKVQYPELIAHGVALLLILGSLLYLNAQLGSGTIF